MAVVLDDVKVYVGADGTEYDSLLDECLTDAAVLIEKYVGEATVPTDIVDRSTLIVAADLFERRNAPNGIVNQQYGTTEGIGYSPMRVARDPLAGVYKILGRWVLPF